MYLLDSDAARKLCQYQLIHELVRALNCALSDIAVLPQLTFQLRLNNQQAALKKLGSEESVALAVELMRHASIVDVKVEQSNHALNFERPDIDSGEAVLFAALYQNAQDTMLSGDKRAFLALSKFDDEVAANSIWVRLICLEEAIMLILQSECFAQVSAKVRARCDVDKAMSIAFGRTQAAEQSSALQALSSYVRDLNRDTGGRWRSLSEKGACIRIRQTKCRP
ncbi:hypothetical protein FQ192_16495 [Pseudomonas sp. ANT_J12]|uniref:hypothetical protein n=1 Tax=Pseudomonas sp. ANT_J12 TaxID=2597351 RepID=UPI0011F2892A|nr:hypothetical protein [Pseudomonas sp. ANT_J12]KAA0988638.1 hypothetical protein FQ192_16495 [Pseudomonas sp. ANT_J12]